MRCKFINMDVISFMIQYFNKKTHLKFYIILKPKAQRAVSTYRASKSNIFEFECFYASNMNNLIILYPK